MLPNVEASYPIDSPEDDEWARLLQEKEPELLLDLGQLQKKSGTTEGAIEGWETRKRGGIYPADVPATLPHSEAAKIVPSEADEWAQNHVTVHPPLTRDQEEVLAGYQSMDYVVINKALRKGQLTQDDYNTSDTYSDKRSVDKAIEVLKSAISKAKVPEPVCVYRGITGRRFTTLKPGDEFVDKGFSSTSFSVTDAERGSQETLLRIFVPAGAPGIYPDAYQEGDSRFDEKELLLQAGSVFKVEGRHIDKKGRRVTDVAWQRVQE